MKIKKILFVALAAMTLLTFLAGGISASETADADNGVAVSEKIGDEGVGVSEEIADEGENAFAALYGMATENADKIFALLSFAGTLMLAFVYKKGLLPALSGAVNRLSEAASRVAEESDENRKESEANAVALKGSIGDFSAALAAVADTLANIEARLVAIEERGGDTEAVKRILACEVDMLSDLFLTSSIPEYQKESVSKRVSDIKRELVSDEEKQEN